MPVLTLLKGFPGELHAFSLIVLYLSDDCVVSKCLSLRRFRKVLHREMLVEVREATPFTTGRQEFIMKGALLTSRQEPVS